jgi:choline dehydrogenase
VTNNEFYDYIVVGGGSSGCVAANRLVTDHGARVLLLEAGRPYKSFLMKWPALAFGIIQGNTFLKHFKSTAQPHLGGKSIGIAQASVLGGGSSVNVMAYFRGSKADYARWTAAAGKFPWGWEQLVPIFKRQEGNRRFDNDAHGGDGPFKVGDPISSPRSTEIFIRTMQRLGLPYRDDFGAGDLRGVGFSQTTIHNSKRCSAADAFIKPIMDDPRLTVLTAAEARKIRFQGTRAVGVEFIHRGKPRYAKARLEVILTAGPLVTPKILMLSGIGPRDHLKSHGIDCIADSPGVGENLHDHPIISLTLTTNGAYGFYGADKGLGALVNAFRYLAFGDGPLASNGADGIAFTNMSDPSAEPDIQIYCIPLMLADYRGGPDGHGVTLCANFVQPRSRGRAWLKSADPADDLLIDYNWLSDPEDRRRMLRGIRYLRKIVATEPFASMVKEERLPGPQAQSDEELMEQIRQNVRTYYHPVGTCKMGSDEDPMAVLTPDLRVRGVEGLRVFDVSMIPNIISSATNATAMVVAERGVELMMQGSRGSRGLA